jgi:hypothetical protein
MRASRELPGGVLVGSFEQFAVDEGGDGSDERD